MCVKKTDDVALFACSGRTPVVAVRAVADGESRRAVSLLYSFIVFSVLLVLCLRCTFGMHT